MPFTSSRLDAGSELHFKHKKRTVGIFRKYLFFPATQWLEILFLSEACRPLGRPGYRNTANAANDSANACVTQASLDSMDRETICFGKVSSELIKS